MVKKTKLASLKEYLLNWAKEENHDSRGKNETAAKVLGDVRRVKSFTTLEELKSYVIGELEWPHGYKMMEDSYYGRY